MASSLNSLISSSTIISPYTITALILLLSLFITYKSLANTLIPKSHKTSDLINQLANQEPTALTKALISALPENVILPTNPIFQKSLTIHWAQAENENVPSCIVQPSTTSQLSTAIKILKAEFDTLQKSESKPEGGIFAIRSGGHSPVPFSASISNGVLIDLSKFDEIVIPKDEKSVTIGTGCKWGDVSRVLDERGLAVVGGRTADVGVGGLVLGGGLSFFTPKHGMVCTNITSYELIIASGDLIIATSNTNADLFHALKAGSNNFGIVTRFTAKLIPCSKIWSGMVYLPARQTGKVLEAFHEEVNRLSDEESQDKHAAGPTVIWSYVAQLGLTVISVNLVHTSPSQTSKSWPVYWKTSPLSKMWRYWSTCKTQSLTSATTELSGLNPPGRRQCFGTCTIENDFDTIKAAHDVFKDTCSDLKRRKVKGLVFTIVFQPFLSSWAGPTSSPISKPIMGFDPSSPETLIIISFTVNWLNPADDDFMRGTTKNAIERIERKAQEKGMDHEWRYLNYCMDWQRPFEGYGEEEVEELRRVSVRVDPEGLWQRGVDGGFKLLVDAVEEGRWAVPKGTVKDEGVDEEDSFEHVSKES